MYQHAYTPRPDGLAIPKHTSRGLVAGVPCLICGQMEFDHAVDPKLLPPDLPPTKPKGKPKVETPIKKSSVKLTKPKSKAKK